MERNQELFEQIETYLEGKLSPENKMAFEKQLKEDPLLFKEVEKHRKIQEAISATAVLDFRKKIQNIERQQEKNYSSKRSNNLWWRMAAVLLIFLGVSSLLWLQLQNESDLFKEYYSLYPVEDTMRGTKAPDIDESLQDYVNGDHVMAIPKIKSLLKAYPEKEIFKLYLGNSYLNTSQESKALRIFNQFSEKSPFYEDALWYTALVHLKLEDIPKTKRILEQVIQYQGVYKNKAAKLLKEL